MTGPAARRNAGSALHGRDGSRTTRGATVTPLRVLVAVGAIASAAGSILGLPPTIRGLLDHPAGSARLTMRSATPMTFGQSRIARGGTTQGYDKSDVALHGALITYDVIAEHFHRGALLPQRLTVENLTRSTLRAIPTNDLKLSGATGCGCAKWVPATHAGDQYDVALALYPPGPVTGEPLKVRHIRFTAR
jgi:hypothetical protein